MAILYDVDRRGCRKACALKRLGAPKCGVRQIKGCAQDDRVKNTCMSSDGHVHADGDFGSTYWRSALAAAAPLPALSSDSIDDATFRMLADNVPTLCWVANGSGYVVWFNRRWHEYCGTTAKEMEGWGWQSVHDPLALPGVMERWTAAIAEGAPFEMTFPLRGADGLFRPFLTRIQPVRDASGAVARWFGVNTEIFDQIAAEKALRIERDRNRDVLEGMDEGFLLLDSEFRVVQLNAETLRLEKRSESEIIGLTHWAAWPGTEESGLGQLYKHAMAERVAVSLEHRYVFPGERDRWYDMRAYPSGDGLAIFYRDITERKLTQAVIAEREQRLRLVIDGARDYAIITTDPDRRITSWSQGATEIFGYAAEEAIGQSADVIFTLEDRAADLPVLEVTKAQREGFAPDERWHLRKDGSRVFMNGSVRPLPVDVNGREQGFIKIARDETGQRRTAEVLAESEARFRNMADQAPVMMWVTNSSGYCTYLNRRWYEYTGQEEGSGEAYGWLDAVHADDRGLAEKAFISANAEQRDYRVEFRVRRSDGVYRWTIDAAAARFASNGEYLGYVGSVIDIDERREHEEALRATTALAESLAAEQAAILGQLAEGVIVADRSGRITFVNEAAARIHGVARLDVAPDAYADIYRLQTVDGVPYPSEQLPLARAVLNQETVLEARWRICRPDGSEVLAVGSARPVLGEAGAPLGAVLTLRDDTERSRAESALRTSEEFNRRILASSADCVKVLDLDGRLEFMSEGGMCVMEVDDFESIGGKCWPDFWQGTEHELALAAVEKAQRGGTGRFQGFATTFKGTPRWWDVIVTAINGADGRPERLLSISRDVTATKLAEEALRDLNETLETRIAERTDERDRAWRLSQDLLVIAEQDGAIAQVNAAWTKLLGWEPGELVGQPLASFTHPEDLDAALLAFASILEAPLSIPYEYRFRHRDGEYRWFAWTGAFEQGRVYASGRHTTAEHEQAEALAKVGEALRQSQKMEAVGQLTGGIAHDFNNLLGGVSACLQVLQVRLKQGKLDGLDRYVGMGQDSVKRAAALTQRLLAFARRQTLDPKPTDLNRLANGLEDLIRRTVGPDVHVEVVGAGGLWATRIDPSQLENSLLNLCINARDAMLPQGGRLTIETANKWLDDRASAERGLTPGQYVSLCVTDTGCGMRPDLIEHIFDPFFTTKPTGEGTGLGLSMVYGFVRQSGGQVRVYSEVGKGTTMCLYLPRYVGSAAEEDKPRAFEVLEHGNGETVLVIEDEATIRLLITEVLEDTGYKVMTASDGPSGLRILRSTCRIDLLVTDVGLPGGLNGRQVADEARLARPSLKVLFITGYAENAAVGNGLLDPGMEVLTKPFEITALAKKVRQMTGSSGRPRQGPWESSILGQP